ncbi:MAG: transporter [Muribaculaceae bacterium]|nr:transporter [Muribaculaceae bacterium]
MKGVIDFLKNWTLPSAIVGGTVIYLIFYWIPALDPVSEVMEPIFDTILPLFMSLILFTTFLRVDFHKMRPAMWHLWVSVFQIVLVVLLVALILGFEMTGKDLILMEGILTCVICPGASAAPVVTGKLGGNLETMTSYVFLSNIVTVVAVPVVFPLIDNEVDISFWTAFWMIMYKVFLVLVLPLIAAYLVKHYLPRVQQRLVAIQDLSFYMWGISLTIVTGCTVKNIINSGAPLVFLLTIAVVSLLICLAQFAVGRYIGHFFGTVIESGQGLGQKNTAFAVWIAYTYLSPLSVAGPGCYILWQNAINSLEIWHHRKVTERQQLIKGRQERQ